MMPSPNDSATDENPVKETPSLARIIFTNLLIGGIIFAMVFRLPSYVNCFSPIAQNLIIALCLLFTLHYFSSAIGTMTLNFGFFNVTAKTLSEILGSKTLLQKRWIISVVAFTLIILIIIFFGSYTYSPFFSEQGSIPILSNIVITTGGSSGSFQPGQKITIKNTSFVSLKAIVLPTDSKCSWSSSYGGTFDNPGKCETSYIPPMGTAVDLLQVIIKSACQFQQTDNHLLISIQP